MNHQKIQQFQEVLQVCQAKATCIKADCQENYASFDLQLRPPTKIKDISKLLNELVFYAGYVDYIPTLTTLNDQLGVLRLELTQQHIKKTNLLDCMINRFLPSGDLIALLGHTVKGAPVWMDLASNPHLLVAGSTGSGKSTLLHNIIANAINYNATEMFIVDTKGIEFAKYENNFSNIKVAYNYEEAMIMLNFLLEYMEHRYMYLRQGITPSTMPYVLFIIDEFADLAMQGKEISVLLCRLAQKCRAARMSIVLSTQRPSAQLLNGNIKANFPARIACKVANHTDSKIILDQVGAEHLCGEGDALLIDNKRSMERFQIAYTNGDEVCKNFQ